MEYKYKYKLLNDKQFIVETGFTNFKGETIIGDDMFLYFDGEVDKLILDNAVANHIAIFPVKPSLTTAEENLIKIKEIIG